MNLSDTDARKGISSEEHRLRTKVAQLNLEISKLQSTIRYQEQKINDLRNREK